MEHEGYLTLKRDSSFDYEFFSEGVRGHILKRVSFTNIEGHLATFNLALGDVDLEGHVDYIITTNNGDAQRVFKTIASVILDFLDVFPERYVFFSGNTPTKTRLYRMTISNNLNFIRQHFTVYGLVGQDFVSFENNCNYLGFLIARKT